MNALFVFFFLFLQQNLSPVSSENKTVFLARRTNSPSLISSNLQIKNVSENSSNLSSAMEETSQYPKQRNWYIAFFRMKQYTGSERVDCGRREIPCYYLQTVLNLIQEGDSVTLISDQWETANQKKDGKSEL